MNVGSSRMKLFSLASEVLQKRLTVRSMDMHGKGGGAHVRSLGEQAEICLQVVLVEYLAKEIAAGELLRKGRVLSSWGKYQGLAIQHLLACNIVHTHPAWVPGEPHHSATGIE